MLGYSWSKEDFREKLVFKYHQNIMKEAIFITGEDCSVCYMMKPHAQRRAEDNGYEFQVFRFDNENVKEFDIQTVPMLILREDGNVKEILNQEDIVNLISKK